MVSAHRGDRRDHPENSLGAITAASQFDMVEIDVRLSADGVPFVMHDDTLMRTAGRPAFVKSLSARELAAIPLRDTDQCVPSLEAALVAAGPSLYFDVDVKDAAELEDVARFLAATDDAHRVMIKKDVYDIPSLEALLDLEARHGIPVTAKARLADDADMRIIEDLSSSNVFAAEIAFSSVELLEAACATGVPISIYTLDEIASDGFSDALGREDPSAVWGRLAEMGVRMLMTDAPEVAKSHFDSVQFDADVAR